MKKHLVCLLLAVALLVCAGVLAVQAEGEQDLCPCCSTPRENIEWLPWTYTSGDADEGTNHYYLTGDFLDQTAQVTIPQHKFICLDLRGYTWVTDGFRTLSISGTFTLMDSVGGGQILTTGSDGSYGSFAFVGKTGTLNIHSGTVRMIPSADVALPTGGLIRVGGGYVNIFGGTVAGGVAMPKDGTAYWGQGGNIYATDNATVTVDGGTVTGGMAYSATSSVTYNSESTSVACQGGNIFASNGATVNIKSGVVSEGFAYTAGGNIFISNATLNVTGGTIKNGYTLFNGGNICQNAGSGKVNTVNISGGTITGGVAGGSPKYNTSATTTKGTGGGGNYYGATVDGVLNISGGTIDGDMKVYTMSSLTLSGAPKIGLGKANGLHIATTALKADVSGLTEGAEIFVNANHVFSEPLADGTTAARIMGYFKEAVRMELSLSDNALKGSTADTVLTGYCPHCYDASNPQKVTWLWDWSSIADGMTAGSHVALRYCTSVSKHFTEDTVVDLCGMSVRRTNGRSASIAGGKSVTILDSCGGGTIQGSGSTDSTAPSWGGVFFVGESSTLTLMSGILDMIPASAGSYVYTGGVICNAAAGGKVNIYGGIVRDGQANAKYSSYSNVPGGNISLTSGTSVLTMSSGIIWNGTATAVTEDETTYPGVGGSIYNAGTTNITGGMILKGTADNGGNIYATVALKGGTVAWGTANSNGGNIYSSVSAAKTIMSGGTVACGKAGNGGNLYVLPSKNTTLEGGVIVGGKATKTTTGTGGGNIYAKASTASIRFNVAGTAQVIGGVANHGGNIHNTNSIVNLTGDARLIYGKAAGTTAPPRGGNVYLNSGTLSITGKLIAGISEGRGGNICTAATSTSVNVLPGAQIRSGRASASYYGGNIDINNGKLTITGGIITDGQAGYAGNIYANFGSADTNGAITIKDDGKTDTPVAQILNGKGTKASASYGGGNITVINAGGRSGTVFTLGDCIISGGESALGKGHNIYINSKAYMKVLAEYNGDTTVYVHKNLLGTGKLDETHAYCEGVFSGKLKLENLATKPWIYAKEGDTALYIASAALVMKDGTTNWLGNNAEVVAAYNDNTKYLIPAAGELALAGKDYVVDLAGLELNITGTGTVTCFDSGNDNYTDFGTATITGVTLNNTVDHTQDGKIYITIQDGETYSFHRLGMRVSSVTFRPGSAGIYYSCTWNCDDVLKGQLEKYGVAVSLVDQPDSNFENDGDTLYTQFAAGDLESGKSRNSVLINYVFKEEAQDNAERGVKGIYAVPYVTLKNGKTLAAQEEVKYSMKDVLSLLEKSVYYENKTVMEEFYQKWQTAMAEWKFENLGVKPGDDDTLRILMIGNSFCYYYVEELYALLMENKPAGINNVEVYNLYYSGRTIATHYNRWSQNLAGDYNLYKTDAEGRKDLAPIQQWTIEMALAEANWDFISIQGSTITSYLADDEEVFNARLKTQKNAEPLLDRFHEMFPYTQLLWHRTWFSEVGRVSGSYTYTEEDGPKYNRAMQIICDYMCDEYDQNKPYDLVQVNSGAAWTEARRLNETLDLLPYGGLCAMMKRNSFGDGRAYSGDGYHDGDIGGAQLLNGYVWYMTIRQCLDPDWTPDVRASQYVPSYTYNGVTKTLTTDHINMLKEAAMSVFEIAVQE